MDKKRKQSDFEDLVSFNVVKKFLPQILEAMPKEWRGTTFRNSNLLGREGFSKNLNKLLADKDAKSGKVSSDDLDNIGNAEDYLRVSTNISTTLEFALAREKGYDVSQVFTFASATMPIISVLLVSKVTVHLFHGAEDMPFSMEQEQTLKLLGGHLVCHAGAPTAVQGNEIVLALASAVGSAKVDGIIGTNVLYIANTEKIPPTEILIVRKRTATPVTTPVAEAMLQKLAGLPSPQLEKLVPDNSQVAEFYAHLQKMSGTEVDTSADPVVFSAGLPAIGALWIRLLSCGGADILMCSTAYGGSSQLTDVLTERAKGLVKHNFHIQGDTPMLEGIKKELDVLASDPASRLPTTVLFVEIPTNPDMKVPDMAELVDVLRAYKKKTGKEVLLFVDTTFAPASQVMRRVKDLAPELVCMVFISMSKSVSRGLTTAGTVIANHTDMAMSLVRGVAVTGALFDTTARPDQLYYLANNHTGVEQRTQKAYEVARDVGASLVKSVKKHTGKDMALAFVKPEHAKQGFTTATFSFNLPSPEGATQEINEGLAQRFVDLLTKHKEFKPCVSFGQDNGLVYSTVPATSTQGAIKAEDKAKQAVGGVQLVRLSFPPTLDTGAVSGFMDAAVRELYSA